MPTRYESPDVKSTLTPDEIRQRYRDTSFIIFKEQYLHKLQKINESEREMTTYLSFGANRRTMSYSNNGNEPVTVHRTMANIVAETNRNSTLSSQIFSMYRKPRDSCVIS